MTVVGWTDAYTTSYPMALFSEDRKKTLIERIRKRQYNFNHFDHEMVAYCCPYYDDGVICVLTKTEFDSVMNTVYNNIPRGSRLLPMDVIDTKPVNGILFEKTKFMELVNK